MARRLARRGGLRTRRYRISVCGRLGEAGREAFGEFDITPDGTNTALTGDLDQSALHGTLNRIRALGLELAGITLLADDIRGVQNGIGS